MVLQALRSLVLLGWVHRHGRDFWQLGRTLGGREHRFLCSFQQWQRSLVARQRVFKHVAQVDQDMVARSRLAWRAERHVWLPPHTPPHDPD